MSDNRCNRASAPFKQLGIVGQIPSLCLCLLHRFAVVFQPENLRRLGRKQHAPVGRRLYNPVFYLLDRIFNHHTQHRSAGLFRRIQCLFNIIRANQRTGAVMNRDHVRQRINIPERVFDRLLPGITACRHHPYLRQTMQQAVHLFPVLPPADHQYFFNPFYPQKSLHAPQ